MEPTVERIIEEQTFIDGIADPLRRGVEALLERAPAVAYVLHGEWLGHPLHAAMVTVPVGSWTAGLVMDLISVGTRSRKLRRGADAATAIGLVGALGAAVAGIAEWSKTRDGTTRVGFVHGATNVAIAGIYGASLFARSRRRRGLGIALSGAGYGLLAFSSWLGGELAYRHGVGVRPEAFRRAQEAGTTAGAQQPIGARAAV